MQKSGVLLGLALVLAANPAFGLPSCQISGSVPSANGAEAKNIRVCPVEVLACRAFINEIKQRHRGFLQRPGTSGLERAFTQRLECLPCFIRKIVRIAKPEVFCFYETIVSILCRILALLPDSRWNLQYSRPPYPPISHRDCSFASRWIANSFIASSIGLNCYCLPASPGLAMPFRSSWQCESLFLPGPRA
jgi:hypothetical protein